jgi:two-component system, OmpR family, sensor histidine kinase KdpD
MSYRNDIHAGTRPATRVPAPYALPAGCAALLVVGATAAVTHGWLSSEWVLALAAVIVAVVGATAEPGTALFMAGAGWLTAAGFSGPPYAQLRLGWHSGARAALVLSLAALAGVAVGWLVRRIAASVTLSIVDVSQDARFAALAAEPQLTGSPAPGEDAARAPQHSQHPRHWLPALAPSSGLARRRQLTGVLLVAILPLLTVVLAPAQHSISLSDDLLIFLVCVVSVAVVGGFWPAVLAAVTASLLLNWFFTPPVHTFTIADPKNILALLLFITVAVTVSSVVHLAARRAVQAASSRADAAALLALAQTVLGGDDAPAAILDHLTGTRGGRGELTERAGDQWVTVACSGSADAGAETTRVPAGSDLMLAVSGQREPLTPGLLDGFAAQAAAALERDRLRTQAAQAEALAEGNRMRTALLAAVSHDLRTPLSSIKASISTLRLPDVQLPEDDEGALLATIEESADRLNALIGNLLDMSRLSTGSLEPLLRPTSIDEVAPLAQRDADSPVSLEIRVPDDLPLVRTDPGLLERVLANLFANAVAHSPAGNPPVMSARQDGDAVLLDVVDHGCGVPDDLKERIFEPFERLSERNTGTGVGLGLAVAHGFLSAMGGTIAALDTPGGGLTMRVTLPAAATAAPSGRTGEQ